MPSFEENGIEQDIFEAFERSIADLAETSRITLEQLRHPAMHHLLGRARIVSHTLDAAASFRLTFPRPNLLASQFSRDSLWFESSRDENVGFFHCYYMKAVGRDASSQDPSATFYTRLTEDMLEIAEDGLLYIPFNSFVGQLHDNNSKTHGKSRFSDWLLHIISHSSSRPRSVPKPHLLSTVDSYPIV